MKRKYIKLIIFLFILNSITLSLYFSSSSSSTSDYFHRRRFTLQQLHKTTTNNSSNLLQTQQDNKNIKNKPWPILPSYLPWRTSLTSKLPPPKFRSCEAYFGNGFTRRLDLLPETTDGSGGWFRCYYSETLRSSICEGGSLRMHPDKIKMSAGGEAIQSVIGRSEDEELPLYEPGAFDLLVPPKVDDDDKKSNNKEFVSLLNEYWPKQGGRHPMRDLIDSVRLVSPNQFHCSQWIEEPTLLITRFEYANLFHTVTDWYSAYVSSRVTGLPNRPQLVFIDGHCMVAVHHHQTSTQIFIQLIP